MIASIPISLLLLGGVFSGVRSKVERTGPPQPARAKNCEILVIDGEESNRQYEVLGRIHIWITRNKITRETGTKVETVRFYEKSGLLPAPARTEGNYRSYDQAHLNRDFREFAGTSPGRFVGRNDPIP